MNYFMLCLYAVFVIATISSAEPLKPLNWPKLYYVKGALHLPNDDHERPFEAWFDGIRNRSRIDYYNGMVKTIQRSGGQMSKIIPTSDALKNEFNSSRCYCNLIDRHIQPTLPTTNVNYVYSGDVAFRNWTAKLFTYTERTKIGKTIYRILVRYEGLAPREVSIPLQYEVEKYNRADIYDRLYEHYYLEYYYYDVFYANDKIFNIEPDDCRVEGTPEYLNPMEPYIDPIIYRSSDEKFDNFVQKFRKQYKDKSETEYRKEVFLQNLEFIESENRANRGYELAINQFADRTDEEYASILGDRPSDPNDFREKPLSDDMRQAAFPDHFDWRFRGAVTPVKNQLQCGASYAFSAVGAIEGAYYLATGNLVRLSEQAIIDCSWTHDDENEGCRRGRREQVFLWASRMGGIPLDGAYGPFLGMEGRCNLSADMPMIGNISAWVVVTPNDTDALKLAIYDHGPVSIAVDARQATFKFYSNGIYSDPNCKNSVENTNHGALVIGYGYDSREGADPREYWIVKNLWGPNWGSNGYVLIAVRGNDCGLSSYPIYAKLEGK